MHRKLLFIIIAALLLLIGCSHNSDSLAIFRNKPFETNINGAEVFREITIYVYHSDGYVNKTVWVEENILENGSVEQLKLYSENINQSFNSNLLQVEGFEFKTELKDSKFTLTTTYDYTKTNIKEELEQGKEFFHVKGSINEEYNITYENLNEAYTEIGFIKEE